MGFALFKRLKIIDNCFDVIIYALKINEVKTWLKRSKLKVQKYAELRYSPAFRIAS